MPELSQTALIETLPSQSLRPIVAIIGGMGPLASAGFVTSIYERSLRGKEQLSPRILLMSDPSFPDRTTAILNGDTDSLRERLEEQVRFALLAGASSVVICCVTMHLIVPMLPPELRSTVVSMVDLCLAELERRQERQLLICTVAVRQLGLFEQHPMWPRLSDYVVYPDDEDQQFIHDKILYGLKQKTDLAAYAAILKRLMDKYGVRSFLAGCSELHLLSPYFGYNSDPSEYRCIDSLSLLAEELAQGQR